MKKYIIQDLVHRPGSFEYLNINHESTSVIPFDYKGEEQPTPIRHFNTKAEAKLMLDKIRSYRLQDWDKNSHFYKVHGYRKPQWKIYMVDV